MSDPVVSLDPGLVTIAPGEQGTATLRVRNTGTLVQQFEFRVLGRCAPWAQVAPPSLSLMPGDEREATLVLRPPSTPAPQPGLHPLGVRCVSTVDSGICAVAETDVDVATVHALSATLRTLKARGRRRGRYIVEAHNAGSVPERLTIVVPDDTKSLAFAVAPTELDLAPGATLRSFVQVRPRRPMLRGQRKVIPVSLSWRSAGAQGQLDGSFEQLPVVAKLVVPMMVVALLAAATAGVMVMRRGGQAPVMAAPPRTPPVVSGFVSAGSVEIRWTQVPEATKYRVDEVAADDPSRIVDSVQVPGERGAYVWKGLPVGNQCFRVSADDGTSLSAPSELTCAKVTF